MTAPALVHNGHGTEAAPDNEIYHARFPHPNPPPEGEGANVSLREFHVNAWVDTNIWFYAWHIEPGRLLVVVHTERRNYVRIISERKATRYERNIYKQG